MHIFKAMVIKFRMFEVTFNPLIQLETNTFSLWKYITPRNVRYESLKSICIYNLDLIYEM